MMAIFKRFRPSFPAATRVYAVGDIHGRVDLLRLIMDLIRKHLSENACSNNYLIFLGDYVDRGEHSKQTIDFILSLNAPRFRTVYLKGNHEALLLNFLADYRSGPPWFKNGGRETLSSYGVKLLEENEDLARIEEIQKEFKRKLPPSHLSFLKSLDLTFEVGDYVFVHAGLSPGKELKDQKEDDLLWRRRGVARAAKSLGKIIVHGHTITKKPVLRRHQINVDTGAFATDILTCAVITKQRTEFIQT